MVAPARQAFAFEVLTESTGKWTVDFVVRHTALAVSSDRRLDDGVASRIYR